jgi:hypothetical protein
LQILRTQGVLTHTIFGSNTLNETPKQLVIGFGPQVPIDVLRHLVRLLEPEGFKYLDYAYDARLPNAVYIGSYKYKHPKAGKLKLIDGNLKALLSDPHIDMPTLVTYFMSTDA